MSERKNFNDNNLGIHADFANVSASGGGLSGLF